MNFRIIYLGYLRIFSFIKANGSNRFSLMEEKF